MESLDRDFTGNSAGKRQPFHKRPRTMVFHIVSENQPNNNNSNSNHDDDDDVDDDKHNFFSDCFNMFFRDSRWVQYHLASRLHRCRSVPGRVKALEAW